MSCLQILNAAYQVEITVRSSSTIIHIFLQRMKQVRPDHMSRHVIGASHVCDLIGVVNIAGHVG